MSLGVPLNPECHVQLFPLLLRKGFKGSCWHLEGNRYLVSFSDICYTFLAFLPKSFLTIVASNLVALQIFLLCTLCDAAADLPFFRKHTALVQG